MPNLASELRPVVNQRLTEVEASGIRAFDQKNFEDSRDCQIDDWGTGLEYPGTH